MMLGETELDRRFARMDEAQQKAKIDREQGMSWNIPMSSLKQMILEIPAEE